MQLLSQRLKVLSIFALLEPLLLRDVTKVKYIPPGYYFILSIFALLEPLLLLENSLPTSLKKSITLNLRSSRALIASLSAISCILYPQPLRFPLNLRSSRALIASLATERAELEPQDRCLSQSSLF